MIQANELRIGNLIYNQGKGISRRITTVSGNIILERTKGKMKLIEPIPLTAEWLLKCNFISKPTMGGVFWHDRKRGNRVMLHAKENGVYLEYFHNTPIKYIHQLQNLYFALTNKEATIKL